MKLINKRLLFLIIIGIMFIPLFQFHVSIFNEKPLRGSYLLSEKPQFAVANWFNSSFQEQYSKYFEDQFGFRSFFVRANNQVQYDLFTKVNMSSTTIGRNQELFQNDYIDSYLGDDYIGSNSIQLGLEKIDFVRHELKKIGTEFLVLLAPGKASYMPENFPNHISLRSRDTSNYEMYVKGLKELDIEIIDFRSYFSLLKYNAKYSLYPLGGAHWSGYSITLVTDTLFKRIEKLLEIDMVGFYDVGGDLTTNLRGTDNDVSVTMNLLFQKRNHTMYYPNIEFERIDSNNTKPNTLIIGDSYAETFYHFYPFYKNCLGANTNFWSYNIWEKYPQNTDKEKHRVKDLNMKNELLSRDIFILVVTQSNLRILGELFINRQYRFFKSLEKDKKYQKELELIKKDLEIKNLTLSETNKNIRLLYNIKYDNKKVKVSDVQLERKEIEDLIVRIKKNNKWYQGVVKQAEERNISIDSMLIVNARSVIEQRN